METNNIFISKFLLGITIFFLIFSLNVSWAFSVFFRTIDWISANWVINPQLNIYGYWADNWVWWYGYWYWYWHPIVWWGWSWGWWSSWSRTSSIIKTTNTSDSLLSPEEKIKKAILLKIKKL